MDTLLQAAHSLASRSAVLAMAVVHAIPARWPLGFWSLNAGFACAQTVILLVRRRPEWKRFGRAILWSLYWLVIVSAWQRDLVVHWPTWAAVAGSGAALSIVGPPITRALRLPQIIAWLLAPVAFLNRTLGRWLAVIVRPIASAWARLPKPSAFQFANCAVLCGCLVLTGLLVKTLFRL